MYNAKVVKPNGELTTMNNKIDIRNDDCTDPVYIQFHDVHPDNYTATRLKDSGRGRIEIQEDDDDCRYITLHNREQAENLIKAIEKAIELNWIF